MVYTPHDLEGILNLRRTLAIWQPST
jgi:hypothetical protein